MTDASTPAAPARPAGFLRALFTERDNRTWDLVRVVWGIGVLAWIARTACAAHWDPGGFATQFSILMGAGGVTLAVKRKTENGAAP